MPLAVASTWQWCATSGSQVRRHNSASRDQDRFCVDGSPYHELVRTIEPTTAAHLALLGDQSWSSNLGQLYYVESHLYEGDLDVWRSDGIFRRPSRRRWRVNPWPARRHWRSSRPDTWFNPGAHRGRDQADPRREEPVPGPARGPMSARTRQNPCVPTAPARSTACTPSGHLT